MTSFHVSSRDNPGDSRRRSLVDAGRRLVARVREGHAAQKELYERMALRQEPWREELLHWSYDGGEWRLHGSRIPRADGRRRSVTGSGWCPGLRQ